MVKKRFLVSAFLFLLFIGAFNYISIRSILIPSGFEGDMNYFNKVIAKTGAKPVSVFSGSYSYAGKMIIVYGNVTKILSPDTLPPRHERFVISDLENNTIELKVIFNVDYLDRGWLNVKVGDLVVLVGEMLDDGISVHKVAEGLDFLILYRPSEGKIVEVGYYPDRDQAYLIGILVADLATLLVFLILIKRGKLA